MAHGLVVLRPRFLVEASRLLLDGRKKRRKETRKEGRIPLAKDGRRLITPPGSFLPLKIPKYIRKRRENLWCGCIGGTQAPGFVRVQVRRVLGEGNSVCLEERYREYVHIGS